MLKRKSGENVTRVFMHSISRLGQIFGSHLMIHRMNIRFRDDRGVPDLYDLYDLGIVAGWKPYSLHDLASVFWVKSILRRQILRNLSQRQARSYSGK